MDFEYAEFVYEVAIGLRNVGRSMPIGCRAQDPGYGGVYHVGQLDIPSLGDQYELDLDFWTEKYKIQKYADTNFVPDTADEKAMSILRMQREVPGRPRKMTKEQRVEYADLDVKYKNPGSDTGQAFYGGYAFPDPTTEDLCVIIPINHRYSHQIRLA
jgi:hypothetical protein